MISVHEASIVGTGTVCVARSKWLLGCALGTGTVYVVRSKWLLGSPFGTGSVYVARSKWLLGSPFGTGSVYVARSKWLLGCPLGTGTVCVARSKWLLGCPLGTGTVCVARPMWVKIFGSGRKSLKKKVILEDTVLRRGFLRHPIYGVISFADLCWTLQRSDCVFSIFRNPQMGSRLV
jgi:hypothetical protein